jgi:hypothetical protein
MRIVPPAASSGARRRAILAYLQPPQQTKTALEEGRVS